MRWHQSMRLKTAVFVAEAEGRDVHTTICDPNKRISSDMAYSIDCAMLQAFSHREFASGQRGRRAIRQDGLPQRLSSVLASIFEVR